MIIDMHTHHRPTLLTEELIKRGQWKINVDSDGRKHVYQEDTYVFTMTEQYAKPDLEKRIEYLDQYGIDMQVLSTPRSSDYSAEDGPDLARITNDGIAELVKKYPDRFIGLASIPIKNKAKSLDELDRAISELGLKGVCISGNIGINIGIVAPMAFFPFSGMAGSFLGVLHTQGKEAIRFFTESKVCIHRWL